MGKKHRIMQDKNYISDFDELMAETRNIKKYKRKLQFADWRSKMKKKKIIIIITIILGVLFLSTGRARTDVYLRDYEVSEDGTKMILKIGVSGSAGYVRNIKRTSRSMNYYFTFYSTFGINSKIGAKDTFEIGLDSNVDAIYFYTGGKGYKQVLQKDETTGEWLVKD